jgi:hypothetical protein
MTSPDELRNTDTDPTLGIDAAVGYLIRSRLRTVIADTLAEFGIAPENLDAYVADTAIRNDLIRAYYARGRSAGVKSERLLCILTDAFALTYPTTYRIIHDRQRQ